MNGAASRKATRSEQWQAAVEHLLAAGLFELEELLARAEQNGLTAHEYLVLAAFCLNEAGIDPQTVSVR